MFQLPELGTFEGKAGGGRFFIQDKKEGGLRKKGNIFYCIKYKTFVLHKIHKTFTVTLEDSISMRKLRFREVSDLLKIPQFISS